ncbi:YaiI/YqxD family protein [Pseudohoeflea coraliihabitans]|uniref:UPF0178 protein KY465_08395 n=1 Tax=Pseudohoeflea coraliihabitans TaxID=2860393 RepID=A0ABS6WMU7_9HYPH|nr:YaiI/YqxD family protein [Pseudohoeflea sp. DP4N28-3]MBW3097297.1 YaiI/YqxD family protein [Pseudohoeflea sp. DP4N28-3]
MAKPIRILVDADACPVKDEAIRVALRHGLAIIFVANAYLRLEKDPLISLEVVPGNFDAADDRIVELADDRSIVVTTDILLAERCLAKGVGSVLSPKGKAFTQNSIGMAVATRSIMSDLRAGGAQVGGPAPFSRRDRSAFLSALDLAIVQSKRNA